MFISFLFLSLFLKTYIASSYILVLSDTRVPLSPVKIYHIHKATCIHVQISVFPSQMETGRQINGTSGLLLRLFLIFLDLLQNVKSNRMALSACLEYLKLLDLVQRLMYRNFTCALYRCLFPIIKTIIHTIYIA